MFLSFDGFTSYSIDLYREIYGNTIVWPRTITTSYLSSSSSSSSSSLPSDLLTLYIGEIFGKIWEVKLNTTILYENHLKVTSSKSKLLSQSVMETNLLFDNSKYPASIEIRNLITKQKFLFQKSELIFPEILD